MIKGNFFLFYCSLTINQQVTTFNININMSYSTIQYPVNFNESDVDSDYNTESSEEQVGQEQAPEEHQEFNMDLSFTLNCLQLLNFREDLFQG